MKVFSYQTITYEGLQACILCSLFSCLYRNRLCLSIDHHLIYPEHTKDFKMAEDGPLKDLWHWNCRVHYASGKLE